MLIVISLNVNCTAHYLPSFSLFKGFPILDLIVWLNGGGNHQQLMMCFQQRCNHFKITHFLDLFYSNIPSTPLSTATTTNLPPSPPPPPPPHHILDPPSFLSDRGTIFSDCNIVDHYFWCASRDWFTFILLNTGAWILPSWINY